PLVRVPRREVGSMRPAVTERNAKPLGVAYGHVRPELARRLQKRQREKIGRHHDAGIRFVCACAEVSVIDYLAVGSRVLQEDAEHILGELERVVVGHYDLHPDGYGTGAYDRD